ncbi:putative lipase maturation factor 1 [Apostichopus japonicus]|uniref:Lipase maturation factor n=1 Tax=Stichopus japonicus TaxID=307972 RepID=A0A2G8KKP9_STIJA|nr:putative lipase maturation factor 1 [Apostichopus japonicus]
MADDNAGSELRQRKSKTVLNEPSTEKEGLEKNDVKEKSAKLTAGSKCIETGTYWLTRIVLLRYLAFIYFVAFLVALQQNKQLLGNHGLLPIKLHLDKILNYVGGEVNQKAISFAPTILWFVDQSEIDLWLDRIAYGGLGVSAFVLISGAANMPLMIILWLLYHSLVSVGQRWYSFGWESQLLETGFLAIFLCPVWTVRQFPRKTQPPWVAIWGYRWLIFRIMLGAGLIKIRGDQCWRDLTCMDYHYETQPVPNPISYYLHQSPGLMHKFETLSNHFIELISCFFVMIPWRPSLLLGAAIQVLFQVVLIISGNLSFLNWLTILPSLACLDDKFYSFLFPEDTKRKLRIIQREDKLGVGPSPTVGVYIRRVMNICLALLIGYLSIPVVQNLLSSRQAMNTSFDSLRLVNTYGAFGSVTKERTEVIFQGTHSNDPSIPGTEWLDYEFVCKPGNVSRRPCLISPYHYRLDWLMWFAAFQNYQANNWFIHLAGKFLMNDEQTMTLIEHNPFKGGEPPKFVRAQHYRYRYTEIGSEEAEKGQWWRRELLGDYLPPVSLESLYDYMKNQSWDLPKYIKKKVREEKREKAKRKT